MQHKLLFITYTHSNGGGAENVLTTLTNHLDTTHYMEKIKNRWFHGAIYDFLPDTPDAKPEQYKQLQFRAWNT